MKVKELIEKLSKCNQEAKVEVIAHCYPYEFSLSYGGGDGCDETNCESVSFYVDKLCRNERTEEEKIRAWDDGGCSMGSSLNNDTVC